MAPQNQLNLYDARKDMQLIPGASVIRQLVLLITTRCNLCCKYCYLPIGGKKIDMAPQTMEQALKRAASGGGRPHVQISGGEPTLNREMIFRTVCKAGEIVPGATVALQTNATLIDDDLARFLRQNSVQVGISLDGLRQVHEKQRGCFEKTLAGMEKLESFDVPWWVTAVVTSDSIGGLWRLVLLLSRYRTARGIGLDFVSCKGQAPINSIKSPSAEAVRQGIMQMLETLDMINWHRTTAIRFREADTLAVMRTCYAGSSFCSACKGESMAIHPDGSVYPCSQFCGEEPYLVGDIYGKIDYSRLRLGLTPSEGNDCPACPLHERCPGDCPSRLLYNDIAAQNAVCTLYQTIYRHQQKEQLS